MLTSTRLYDSDRGSLAATISELTEEKAVAAMDAIIELSDEVDAEDRARR